MLINYKVTRTKAGEQSEHRDFTVVFETSQIVDGDSDAIRAAAAYLVHSREIGDFIDREVDLFVRNGRVVAVVHYTNVTSKGHDQRVEADHLGLVEHLVAILGVFDAKGA